MTALLSVVLITNIVGLKSLSMELSQSSFTKYFLFFCIVIVCLHECLSHSSGECLTIRNCVFSLAVGLI